MSQSMQIAPESTSLAPAAGMAGSQRVSRRTPLMLGVLAAIAVVAFGLLPSASADSTLGISARTDFVQIPAAVLPSRMTALVLALLCSAIAVYSGLCVRAGRRTPRWAVSVFGVLWVLAFLVWAVAGKSVSLTGLLQGALLLAVPLVFGALSGVLCERAGVVNIAIEGQLLLGAFGSAVVGSITQNLYAGLLAAPVAALLIGSLLALFTVRYKVDQIIVGVVLNVFAAGLTGFFFGTLISGNASLFNSPPRLDPIEIPVLSQIPVIGPVVFNQTLIVYLMYLAVIGVNVALFKTRWGLRVRAVGEHPQAADTVGINVNRTRWRNVLLGSAVAGLGGAFFTLGQVGAFTEEMTAGKGYIALAAMILGRWSPVGALAAALLFGFADQLQLTLGVIGTPVPNQFTLMLPYVVTILAVGGLVGRVRGPAAAGVPYIKG